MRRAIIYIVIAFIFSPNNLFAQKQVQLHIDSLLMQLPHLKDDTNKVLILNRIALDYRNINKTEVKKYAEQALKLAEHLQWKKGIANAYHNIAIYYHNEADYPSAKEYYSKAARINEQINNNADLQRNYHNLGVLCSGLGDQQVAFEYYSKALTIAKTLGEKIGVFNELNIMGDYCLNNDDIPKAIDYFQQALHIAEEISDKDRVALSLFGIASVYQVRSDYTKALKYFQQAEKLYDSTENKKGLSDVYMRVGMLYSFLNDYKQSLVNYEKALKILEGLGLEGNIPDIYLNMAQDFVSNNSDSSALVYAQKALDLGRKDGMKNIAASSLSTIARVYIHQKKYSEIITLLDESSQLLIEIGDKFNLAANYLDYGTTWLMIFEDTAKRGRTSISVNKQAALKKAGLYFNKAVELSREIGTIERLPSAYSGLGKVYEHIGDFKKANEYNKLSGVIKDSILNESKAKTIAELKEQYESEKKDAAIALLTKDKELQAAVIDKEKTTRKYLFAGTLVLLLAGGFTAYHFNERRKSRFRQQLSDTEMKALRSQMNPHFIFNSLNSVYRYLQQNDTDGAARYIGNFSKLIRLILENSMNKNVTLADELEALELYITLEAERIRKKIKFDVQLQNGIDKEATLVPPLILQPFIENSILHGLETKDGEGAITLNIRKENDLLKFEVQDNGIGRKLNEQAKPEGMIKKTSLGMKLTEQRIALLNKSKKAKAYLTFTDLFDEMKNPSGVKVELALPLET